MGFRIQTNRNSKERRKMVEQAGIGSRQQQYLEQQEKEGPTTIKEEKVGVASRRKRDKPHFDFIIGREHRQMKEGTMERRDTTIKKFILVTLTHADRRPTAKKELVRGLDNYSTDGPWQRNHIVKVGIIFMQGYSTGMPPSILPLRR